jgi:HD superfamily phosphohydrolase
MPEPAAETPSPAEVVPIAPRPRRAVQEFFVPVWHAVRLTDPELDLLDHPAFQRLADIYQLGQTHLVFRGATHKRWEHALGTLYAAQLMVSEIARNYRDAVARDRNPRSGRWVRVEPFRPHETAFVRLAALLHDIGHIAAGHTFEDELGLLDKHDADGRLTYVLDKITWRGERYPSLRSLIDSLYASEAAASGLGISASEIYLELVSKSRCRPDRTEPVPTSSEFRMQPCRDIVGNTICADLLDYLHRDWHHLGKPREVDRRLLEYFELREDADSAGDVHLVIDLRERANVRLDAVTAVFELLESRYQLGEVALYHRTKLTASAMLERLVAEVADAADDEKWLSRHLDRLLECSDEELVQWLVVEGERLAAKAKGERAGRLRQALVLGRSLRYRELHKQVVAFNAFELAGGVPFVREALGGANGARRRLSDCRSLERDFHLPAGSVVLYCPARAPHAKIAEVQVLVHEQVLKLADLEGPESPDQTLTAGLMQAQLLRFNRLWRVQVSVSEVAKRQLISEQTFADFERAVEALVLRAGRSTGSPEDIARDIARSLIENPAFMSPGKRLVAAGEVHAQGRETTYYASGAPTLSSLILDAE